MTTIYESLDNIRNRLILQRIENEITYLNENPLQKTDERFNYLLEMKTKYNVVEVNKSNEDSDLIKSTPLDNSIKRHANTQKDKYKHHNSDEIITSSKDLDELIDSLSNKDEN